MDNEESKAAALYPVSEKQADRIRTPGGHKLSDLTLENVLAGKLTARDIGISPGALQLQGEVARAVGRSCLADNFDRGAELTDVPQDEILETYELLRPGRARDKKELLNLAERYREKHAAPNIARLIEEAAEVYALRGLFRKRF
jgi:propanediol dehydratase small subunit